MQSFLLPVGMFLRRLMVLPLTLAVVDVQPISEQPSTKVLV